MKSSNQMKQPRMTRGKGIYLPTKAERSSAKLNMLMAEMYRQGYTITDMARMLNCGINPTDRKGRNRGCASSADSCKTTDYSRLVGKKEMRA